MRRWATFLFSLSLVTSVPAQAWQGDDVAEAVQAEVRSLVTELNPPPPEGEAPPEFILSGTDVDRSLERGALSGLLEICGEDWDAISFGPFMASIRGNGGYSGQQIDTFSFMHGFAQGVMVSNRRADAAHICTAERVAIYRSMAGLAAQP